MGELYPAHDTHLTPSCCSQDSSGLFAADAARLTRFKREAEILALLNHTNIATIH
jgi:hypothetical protein